MLKWRSKLIHNIREFYVSLFNENDVPHIYAIAVVSLIDSIIILSLINHFFERNKSAVILIIVFLLIVNGVIYAIVEPLKRRIKFYNYIYISVFIMSLFGLFGGIPKVWEQNNHKVENISPSSNILLKYIEPIIRVSEDGKTSESCIKYNRVDLLFRLYNNTKDTVLIRSTFIGNNLCRENPLSPTIKFLCNDESVQDKRICSHEQWTEGYALMRILNFSGEKSVNPSDSIDIQVTQDYIFSSFFIIEDETDEYFQKIIKEVISSNAIITFDSLIKGQNSTFKLRISEGSFDDHLWRGI